MSSIYVNDITKSYRQGKTEIPALQGITLDVSKGELFGLIGPDGAGKTSLIRILTTLLLPKSGNATIGALDVVKDYRHLRKIIGYMPGKFSLYQDLTVEENLTFFASIFNTSIQNNYHLIGSIYEQLAPFKNRRAGQLSGGMKQKLALCCALIHKPLVLFLDEPTTGVDAVSRKEFWQMLQLLKNEGITIFVSTPYMDEAKLCDRIALIQNGRLLMTAAPDKVALAFGNTLYGFKAAHMFNLLLSARLYPHLLSAFLFGGYCHIALKANGDLQEFVNFLALSGQNAVQWHIIEPSIEDVFMHLMQNTHV